MKRVLYFLLVCSPLSCQGPTGVGLARLHVEATHTDGTSVAGFEGENCTTLPILLGSRIEEKIPIETPFEVVVGATREEVALSFRGAADEAPAFSVSEGSLRSGYSEELSVVASSGTTFKVILTSTCPVTAKP